MTTETLTTTAPAETVTPLRPSEAMRLGRMLYPGRLTLRFFDDRGGACAIGAALAGYGHGPGIGTSEGYAVLDAVVDGVHVTAPDCTHREWRDVNSVTNIIFHLNDIHDWSTERIASWLEGLGI